jgi:hypothetical protein
VHVVTVVEQLEQGDVQGRHAEPLSEYPEIQVMHNVAEVEQVAQGEVQRGQVAPLR